MPRFARLLMSPQVLCAAALFALAAAPFVGCSGTADDGPSAAVIQSLRQRLVLAEEPAGAVTPLDLREQEGGFDAGDVVLVGQVGGMPSPWEGDGDEFPWVAGEATFFLVDPATVAEFADHAPDDPDHAANCPFCARKAKNSTDSIVTVTFKDGPDAPIAIDSRDLLQLKQDDMVVVRGAGKILAGALVVEADGIYIRR